MVDNVGGARYKLSLPSQTLSVERKGSGLRGQNYSEDDIILMNRQKKLGVGLTCGTCSLLMG